MKKNTHVDIFQAKDKTIEVFVNWKGEENWGSVLKNRDKIIVSGLQEIVDKYPGLPVFLIKPFVSTERLVIKGDGKYEWEKVYEG